MSKLVHYRHAIITLIGAVGSWGVTASADNTINLQEYFGLAVAIAAAFGVAAITNKPPTEEQGE